jgi:hypothetical protein
MPSGYHRSVFRSCSATASRCSARRTQTRAHGTSSPGSCPVAFSFATAWLRLTPMRRTSRAARISSAGASWNSASGSPGRLLQVGEFFLGQGKAHGARARVAPGRRPVTARPGRRPAAEHPGARPVTSWRTRVRGGHTPSGFPPHASGRPATPLRRQRPGPAGRGRPPGGGVRGTYCVPRRLAAGRRSGAADRRASGIPPIRACRCGGPAADQRPGPGIDRHENVSGNDTTMSVGQALKRISTGRQVPLPWKLICWPSQRQPTLRISISGKLSDQHAAMRLSGIATQQAVGRALSGRARHSWLQDVLDGIVEPGGRQPARGDR